MADVISFPRRTAFQLHELSQDGKPRKFVRDFDTLVEAIMYPRRPNRIYGIIHEGRKVWPVTKQ